MSDPYGNKPQTQSDANDWHELSFQISIDQPVDWDEVDLRKWAHSVAKYTALMMAKSTLGEVDEPELIKTLIMGIKVARVSFVTDDELHSMIDEFGDDE
jgi:hypothetical protein